MNATNNINETLIVQEVDVVSARCSNIWRWLTGWNTLHLLGANGRLRRPAAKGS